MVFYHGSFGENEERDNRATDLGAVGATTSPATLYRWVLSTLLMKAIIRNDELRHLILLIPGEMMRRLGSEA